MKMTTKRKLMLVQVHPSTHRALRDIADRETKAQGRRVTMTEIVARLVRAEMAS